MDVNLNELLLGSGSERKTPLRHSIDKDARFLVTGGAGSIGRELTLQLLDNGASNVAIFDNSDERLRKAKKSVPPKISKRIHVLLGDVCSSSDLKKAISVSAPDCVFHLAALKHVDLAEQDPYGTYEVNVEGTFKLLKASAGVRRFMLMSTDKSVFPAGLMGATKRMAELAVMSFARHYPKCDYSIVRSGNVIGTSGSALNRFVYQIENTQEITVTHPKMARFFISNVELASLIICAVLGQHRKRGSSISYIVDCGRPISIVDVVRRITEYFGKKVVADNPGENELVIKFTGIRGGEKLEEQMHQSSDVIDTDIEKIKIGLDDGFESTRLDLPNEFLSLPESSTLYIDDLISRFYAQLDAFS